MKFFSRLRLEIQHVTEDGIKEWTNWRSLRNSVIDEHPHCSVCGWEKKLEAHHIIPRHIDHTKILDKSNIIVLCKKCHFTIGHWCDYVKRYNPDIEYVSSMVTNFRKKQDDYYKTIDTRKENEDER